MRDRVRGFIKPSPRTQFVSNIHDRQTTMPGIASKLLHDKLYKTQLREAKVAA